MTPVPRKVDDMPSRRLRALACAAFALASCSCSITDPLGFAGLSFRLESTDDFAVCGIVLDDLSELNASQVLQIVNYWAAGEVPVEMTLNVGIHNPNDGSAGFLLAAATIVSMPWDLYLDTDAGAGFDTTWVASGEWLDPFEVPGDSTITILPLVIGFDAVQVLSVMDAVDFIDLALAVGGIDGDLRDDEHLGRLLLEIEPTIDTPFGSYTYPEPLGVRLDWVE
ncbi:MAG TPA: hypothetical protein PLF04_02175 [Candidatus Fermentibacter daniensis]|jgi:hypothetical protein|nr:MAG: hypothetical protein AO395_07250 [Candidatus Fermentibacter daniensis]KZD15900.1 MAG: hypothetical protein AO394_07475 [Candidatus Fermentibacter daniensis]HOZ17122.1 hypothetical protein [Candidatus Fermentibacter daniensis]